MEIGRSVHPSARDWRDPKLAQISTEAVRELQRARLDDDGFRAVEQTVREARARSGKGVAPSASRSLKVAARKGLDHCLERTSVPRLADALAAALRFGLQEEMALLQFARRSRGTFPALGDNDGARLDLLDDGQRRAIVTLANNRHGIAILIGDAGTGEPHTLARLDKLHRHAMGAELIALAPAPTTRATAELQANGYPDAATVAALLNREHLLFKELKQCLQTWTTVSSEILAIKQSTTSDWSLWGTGQYFRVRAL